MENNIPILETPQPVRGVRWKQTTAGVLFVLTSVLSIVEIFAPQLFYVIPIGNGDLTYMSAIKFTEPLFVLCAFLLLRPLSVNRVVRLVTLLLTIALALVLVARIFAYLVFAPDTHGAFFVCQSIMGFVNLALTFASIFSFACILKNCTQLLGSARVWIQFILCVQIIGISFFIYGYLFRAIPEGIDVRQIDFVTVFYGIFNALIEIMLAIAYYKFAKSDLFGGVFDDSPVPVGAYSIVNKYWAAVLVVIVLFTVAMYLVVSNADKLLYS